MAAKTAAWNEPMNSGRCLRLWFLHRLDEKTAKVVLSFPTGKCQAAFCGYSGRAHSGLTFPVDNCRIRPVTVAFKSGSVKEY